MTEFNPNYRYIFHAEALEESLMSYTHGDVESWADALSEFLDYLTDSDAQKVLSELKQDTTREGARARLWQHYASPDTRDAVISSWHEHGQYLPEETDAP